MVFFNYATMQMAAKIVYYGPGLCGKTTNLHVIYGRTAPTSRGEMVSLETETDRTLFFDLLPLDVGVIGGFKTRLQLYTVPGQVFYNTTRKLVLKGVDGIVFVADSQRPMLEPNRESLKNLRENLAEIGITLDDVPRVFQFNKRDLSNICSVEELSAALNPDGSAECFEASAMNGVGVFETLKAISKHTLKALRTKMTTEVRKPGLSSGPPSSISIPALGAPSKSSSSGLLPAGGATGRSGTLSRLERFAELSAQAGVTPPATPVPPPRTPTPPPIAVPVLDDPFPPSPPAPADTAAVPALVTPGKPPKDDSAEVSFAETAVPSEEVAAKQVRVRSNVDILSELDKLRKVATQKPTGTTGAFASVAPGADRPDRVSSALSRPKTSPGMSLDDLLTTGLNHKKELAKAFEIGVPREALGKSRQVTVALRFCDDAGRAVTSEKTMDLEVNLRDIHKLLLSLKITVEGQ